MGGYMISAKDLRAKRIAAGLAAELVAAKARIERGRLSRIERQIIVGSPEELERIRAVIDELARAKQQIEDYAASVGWPATVGV
jgi:transcriptional regulator with XRE-family HTH domain